MKQEQTEFIKYRDTMEKLPEVIITDLQEGDYMDRDLNGIYRNFHKPTDFKSEFIRYMNNEFKDADWEDEMVWRNLEDKFKTTNPFKRVSKTFRVNWSKVFKRGFLIFK